MLRFLAIATFCLALSTFFLHDIAENPQNDTEIINYGIESISAISQGTFSKYYFQERKYPLFNNLVFGGLYYSLTTPSYYVTHTKIYGLQGQYLSIAMLSFVNTVGRLYTVVFALGCLLLVQKISLQLFQKSDAAVLLMGSILFFMFSTAARPHIHVTFWMLLSLYFSLHLASKKTIGNFIGAFASAVCAFCTLQNGIFVFLFPLWASTKYGFSKKNILSLLGILCMCAIVSIGIGYPYLLDITPDTSVATLGHNVHIRWNGSGFRILLNALLGSEPLLFLLSIGTLILAWKKKVPLSKNLYPILIFLAAYYLVFGIYGDTYIRYFVVTTPLLAILAVPAFMRLPRWSQNAVWILIIILHAKFLTLSLQPNTYQTAIHQLQEVGGGIVMDVPYSALGIPEERKVDKKNHEWALFYLALSSAPVPDIWIPCVQINASNDKYRGTLFLWNDVPWAWNSLLHTNRLGPNLVIHCKKDAMDAQV